MHILSWATYSRLCEETIWTIPSRNKHLIEKQLNANQNFFKRRKLFETSSFPVIYLVVIVSIWSGYQSINENYS